MRLCKGMVDALGVFAEAEPGLLSDCVPAADVFDSVLTVTTLYSTAKRPAVSCQNLRRKQIHAHWYRAERPYLARLGRFFHRAGRGGSVDRRRRIAGAAIMQHARYVGTSERVAEATHAGVCSYGRV
eukprot:COSAG05_NODE_2566_length_2889_cov_2.640143_2_plen_127_part_00